jgi:hypothetical protein
VAKSQRMTLLRYPMPAAAREISCASAGEFRGAEKLGGDGMALSVQRTITRLPPTMAEGAMMPSRSGQDSWIARAQARVRAFSFNAAAADAPALISQRPVRSASLKSPAVSKLVIYGSS